MCISGSSVLRRHQEAQLVHVCDRKWGPASCSVSLRLKMLFVFIIGTFWMLLCCYGVNIAARPVFAPESNASTAFVARIACRFSGFGGSINWRCVGSRPSRGTGRTAVRIHSIRWLYRTTQAYAPHLKFSCHIGPLLLSQRLC